MGLEYVGTVIAYHGAGATFMKGKPVYSTKNADDYNHKGGGAGLVNNFAGAFGEAVAPQEIADRSICINGDIGEVLGEMV